MQTTLSQALLMRPTTALALSLPPYEHFVMLACGFKCIPACPLLPASHWVVKCVRLSSKDGSKDSQIRTGQESEEEAVP